MKNRIISIVLVVSTLCTMLVAPARADFKDTFASVKSLVGDANFILGLVGDITSAIDWFTTDYPNVADSYTVSSQISKGNAYLFDDIELNLYSYDLNAALAEEHAINLYARVAPIADTGYLGILLMPQGPLNKDEKIRVNKFLVADDGLPIVAVDEDFQPADEILSSALYPADPVYYMLERSTLYNRAQIYMEEHPDIRLQEVLVDGVYEWRRLTPDERVFHVLCTADGLPLGAYSNESVLMTERPVEDTEIPLPSGMDAVMNLGAAYLDGSLFDSLNNEFYFDFNIPIEINNNYYYNFVYEYHINYTSITYIGASAEYTEVYDAYYTLPDGRSSADLSAEELEQLNVNMDVISYGRDTDDARLRSLYHFDGNTDDSSYWNYLTDFQWLAGASITYMEANAFDGCLYLDELDHSFQVKLPSLINSGDFTIDFRYYQSATVNVAADSYLEIGGDQILQFNGAGLVFNGNSYPIGVGSWNHIALDLFGSTLRLYLNGVLLASKTHTGTVDEWITFSFSDTHQTYKYFDELRVLNFAAYAGEQFTPPVVPYDTNLALVLPGQKEESRLPEGYTEVSYIESHDGAYINAGFKPNNTTRVVGDFYFTGTGADISFVFGARTGATNQTFAVTNTYSSETFRSDYGSELSSRVSADLTQRVLIDKNGCTANIAGQILTSSEVTFTCDYELYIFALNNGGTVDFPCNARLYFYQVYDNGVLIRDFVPCLKAGSQVGLYDLVEGVFYGNAGSGYFTADVEAMADEYVSVEHTGTQLLEEYDFRGGEVPELAKLYYGQVFNDYASIRTWTVKKWDNFYGVGADSLYFTDPNVTTVIGSSQSIVVTNTTSSDAVWVNDNSYDGLNTRRSNNVGLYIPFEREKTHSNSSYKFNSADLTCTIVYADGSSDELSTSISFTSNDTYLRYKAVCDEVSISHDWGVVGVGPTVYSGFHNYDGPIDTGRFLAFYICPYAGQSVEIAYIVLETGSKSTVKAEYVSGVFDGVSPGDLHLPTLAVRSDVEISRYQIGGIRPSVPEKGLVWALVESGYITSLQIYNGYTWEQCDGRIWTGVRWIPYSSYNVITMNDMYDISGTTSDQYNGFEYIYTQQGFWTWFQKQWITFTTWCYTTLIDAIGAAGSGSGGAAALPEDVDQDINLDTDPESQWDFGAEDVTLIILIGYIVKDLWETGEGVVTSLGNVLLNVPKAVNEFTVQGNIVNPVGAMKVFILPGT